MKKQNRASKSEKDDRKLPVANSDEPASHARASDVMKKIQSRLRATKFKDGFRVITEADLQNDDIARAELDFRIIRTPQETIQAVRYEYLREVESAYLAVEEGLKSRQESSEGSNATKRPATTPPTNPLLWRIDDRLRAFFPMPYASIPESIRAGMRVRANDDCVRELDETKFRVWEATCQGAPPAIPVIFSFHRLVILWNGRRIKAIQQAVSRWIAKHAPKAARLQKRDELTKRPNDALSQLCAWRGSRAGISHSDYKGDLFKRLQMKSHDKGLQYSDASAYQKAGAGAEARARKLR
ncbi:MAG: hypothetical protein ABIP85_22680 [Chthoniobacteraceae bacterium]